MAATHATSTRVVRPAATSLVGRRPAARGAAARRTPYTRQVRSPADAVAGRPSPSPGAGPDARRVAAPPTTF